MQTNTFQLFQPARQTPRDAIRAFVNERSPNTIPTLQALYDLGGMANAPWWLQLCCGFAVPLVLAVGAVEIQESVKRDADKLQQLHNILKDHAQKTNT